MTDLPYLHPQALCESPHVGAGTRIWAFAHVLPGARIGQDCNICDGVFIENDVVVGDRVTIKCGVQLWDGITVEDDVFIGPNATFTNDSFPRSRRPPPQFARTILHQGASIGANATILPGLTIGRRAMIEAGSVVTRPVPSNAIVRGNPATIVGYVDANELQPRRLHSSEAASTESSRVNGVSLKRLRVATDLRGSLVAGEVGSDVPFTPQRYFVGFDVPSRETRGEHAHRSCHQFLVCVHGSVSVVVDDGRQREEFLLDSPKLGLHVPAMVWASQYRYSADAVMLVLASDNYDPEDYIRDYECFVGEVTHRPSTL